MSTPKDCPFCLQNNFLKVPILEQTQDGFLIAAYNSPGNFLIVPRVHAETPADLPATWWHDVTQLLAHVPGSPDHYNVSVNIGQHAGQTVRHLHFWIIPRQPNQPASGKGLATLITQANTTK